MNINEKTNGELLSSNLYTTSSGISTIAPVNTSYIIGTHTTPKQFLFHRYLS